MVARLTCFCPRACGRKALAPTMLALNERLRGHHFTVDPQTSQSLKTVKTVSQVARLNKAGLVTESRSRNLSHHLATATRCPHERVLPSFQLLIWRTQDSDQPWNTRLPHNLRSSLQLTLKRRHFSACLRKMLLSISSLRGSRTRLNTSMQPLRFSKMSLLLREKLMNSKLVPLGRNS